MLTSNDALFIIKLYKITFDVFQALQYKKPIKARLFRTELYHIFQFIYLQLKAQNEQYLLKVSNILYAIDFLDLEALEADMRSLENRSSV